MTAEEVKAAKAAKAEYMRRWAQKNREKKREADLRYWLGVAKKAEAEHGVEAENQKGANCDDR